MAEKVSVAEVKAKLSALLGEVAYGGKRFIIQRHGRPLAALVNVKDLERLEESQEESKQLHWALALVGVWKEVEDWEIDSLVSDICASREKDTGRQRQAELEN
jgi:prevent-host-death family protein